MTAAPTSGLVVKYEPIARRTLPSRSVSPRPFPGSPRLLLMTVRSLNGLALSARTSVSGFPTRPNPPTISVAPSEDDFGDSLLGGEHSLHAPRVSCRGPPRHPCRGTARRTYNTRFIATRNGQEKRS